MKVDADLRRQLARTLREAHRASRIDVVTPYTPKVRRCPFMAYRTLWAFVGLVMMDITLAPLTAHEPQPQSVIKATFEREARSLKPLN